MAFEQLDPVRYRKVEPANTDILPVVASFHPQNYFSDREKRRQDTSEAFAGPLKKVLFSNISMALIRHFSITLFFEGREATTGNASDGSQAITSEVSLRVSSRATGFAPEADQETLSRHLDE